MWDEREQIVQGLWAWAEVWGFILYHGKPLKVFKPERSTLAALQRMIWAGGQEWNPRGPELPRKR